MRGSFLEVVDMENRIENFRNSTVSSLLSPSDFVDWTAIESEISRQKTAIDALQQFVDEGDSSHEHLSKFLSEVPSSYPLLLSLLAFNASGTQIEKWGLPDRVPATSRQRERLAKNLVTIGFSNLFEANTNVIAQLRIAEVYKDSFKRRFRSGNQFERSISGLVKRALSAVNEQTDQELRSTGPSILRHTSVSRFLNYIILQGERPIAGVATVFQQQSGGRQQRELSVTYPNLQSNLRELGISLVLIADGPGIQDTSRRALEALFEGVRFPMTIQQAEQGDLAEALLETQIEPEAAPLESAAVDRIIMSTMEDRGEIQASDLPLGSREASLALARFVETNRNLGIQMSSNASKIVWQDSDLVLQSKEIDASFDPEKAIRIFSKAVGADLASIQLVDGDCEAVLSLERSAPFPNFLYVKAANRAYNSELSLQVTSKSMELAQDARFSILLTPQGLESSELSEHRRLQTLRAVSIVVLSPSQLAQASKSSAPRAFFVDELLRQADLSKVSPYVLSNATPSQMFFGRDQEAASTLATVATNSVALLGSRRIGKTSLLRRLRDDLNDANFSPFFGDCQTVRTWGDFAKLAKREWKVSVPDDFSPSHLADLALQLQKGSQGRVVILLDEIDQLLLWDMQHDENSVPEAFFRACRSLSQSGDAQFIFTGEREISKKIWDPQSPHWNFCRPIQLTQLPRKDALELLLSPLGELGIDLPQRSKTADLAWKYTSGHPQLVQFLGDRLIRTLAIGRYNSAFTIEPSDVERVCSTFEYAEHYVTTYLGQANELERAIAYQFGEGPLEKSDIRAMVRTDQDHSLEPDFETALRMLQLYGLLQFDDSLFTLRAEWMPRALEYYGMTAPSGSN